MSTYFSAKLKESKVVPFFHNYSRLLLRVREFGWVSAGILRNFGREEIFQSFYAHTGFDPNYFKLAYGSPSVVLQFYKNNFLYRSIVGPEKNCKVSFCVRSKSLVNA